ncbi:hypothetical protein [Parashewanella tropica]|uniref:hypothetical protein n=1 Tax=Parashewanella tropica TaxID=2547970 RepID=UPI00105A68FE|nr:hypothetical protein [Parashewanella tropica]
MSFEGIAKSFGAEVFYEFRQSTILQNLDSFEARQIEFPRGYIDARSDNSTLGGCCFALCMVMMQGNFDYGYFLSKIKTKEGIGQIRGYQFINNQNVTFHDGQILRRIFTDYDVPIFGRIGLSFKNFKSYIKKKKVCFFHVVITCVSGAHAICLGKIDNKISVFDPNVGFFTFLDKPIKDVVACLDELTKFMGNYGGTGRRLRYIHRLTPKDV